MIDDDHTFSDDHHNGVSTVDEDAGSATGGFSNYSYSATAEPTRVRPRIGWFTLFLALLLGLGGGVAGATWNDDIKDFLGIEASSDESSFTTKVTTPTGSTKKPTGKQLTANQIYTASAPGVVHVSAEATVQSSNIFGVPQQQRGESSGSGFVINKKGYIVTNAHVVAGATKVTVSFSDEKEYAAKIIGQDTSTDLAVLQVDATDSALKKALVPVPVGDSKHVEVGDPVVAIGNPFNLDRTLTTGVVSALQRELRAENNFTISDVIQTDAAINPGNSGGPLFNMFGEVIGINSQIASPGASSSSDAGSVGIGFAIPSNTVTRVVEELIKSGSVEHAWLGVVGMGLTDDVSDYFKLPVKSGVLLAEVDPDSPAGKAGLKGGDTEVIINGENYKLGGDILVEFDGEKVTEMRDLVDLVNAKESGDKVVITYYQGDKKKSKTVTLATRPSSADEATSTTEAN